MNNQSVYPVRPVISSNDKFAKSYNAHPMSAMMVSACVSAEEAERLVNRGARFSSIHIIGDLDDALVSRLVASDKNTYVHHIAASDTLFDGGIEAIHGLIQAELANAGIG